MATAATAATAATTVRRRTEKTSKKKESSEPTAVAAGGGGSDGDDDSALTSVGNALTDWNDPVLPGLVALIGLVTLGASIAVLVRRRRTSG